MRHYSPLFLGFALLLSSPGAAQERGPRRAPQLANPSAIIAREIAFAQAAQEKGQWSAFAAFSAPDAIMFVPEMVLAQRWLKGRANPASAIKWQPTAVWSSCDGSLAVSHGLWQGDDGKHGWFTTIWQRQSDGSYRWVLDHGDTLASKAESASDMLPGLVADCPERKRVEPTAATASKVSEAAFDPLARSGRSRDGSLDWSVTVSPAGERRLVVSWQKDGSRQVIRDETVERP